MNIALITASTALLNAIALGYVSLGPRAFRSYGHPKLGGSVDLYVLPQSCPKCVEDDAVIQKAIDALPPSGGIISLALLGNKTVVARTGITIHASTGLVGHGAPR